MTTATSTRPASAASLRYLNSLQVELARIVGADTIERSADDVAHSQRLTSAAIDAMKQAIAIAKANRPVRPTCPVCGEPVEFDGGLFHCDTDGAWDRDGVIWVDASGAIVDDPSEYSRRAAAARR